MKSKQLIEKQIKNYTILDYDRDKSGRMDRSQEMTLTMVQVK